jgi:hypothetical protein
VLGEQVERPGGDEVDAVLELVGRRGPAVVQGELPGHPAAVEAVGGDEEDQEGEG